MGRFLLLFTALSPAFLIASIRIIPSHPWVGYIGIVLGLLMFPAAWLLLGKRSDVTPHVFTPISVHDESDQIPTYLVTFVFPFLFVTDSPSVYTTAAYVLFATFLIFLLYRADISVVNPALLIRGFHVYGVETETGSIYLISRRRPMVATHMEACRVSGNLYMPRDEMKKP